MAKEKSTKKEVRTRGAAPKISLALTGIETFALLIVSIVLLLLSRTLSSDSSNLVNSSSDSTLDGILELFGAGLNEILSQLLVVLGVVLLVCGIWNLIFWFICLKSKTHRVRDAVCTLIGRAPGLILIVLLLSSGMIGWFLLIIVLWVFLMFLLSAVGWKKGRR